MNDAQVEEITSKCFFLVTLSIFKKTNHFYWVDVTMTHFTEFRTRKDTTPQMMNRPQVRLFITQVLQNRKKAAKRRIWK